jgi:hypothetical protein
MVKRLLASVGLASVLLLTAHTPTIEAHTQSTVCKDGYWQIVYYRTYAAPYGHHGHSVIGYNNTYNSC